MLKEFREFAIKGNMLDLAIGVILGTAFGNIVNSLVKDVIMPPIGLLLGRVDFANLFAVLGEGKQPGPYTTPEVAQQAGAVTLNYGLFINVILNFVIVAAAMFFVVKAMNRLRGAAEAEAAGAPETPQQEKLLAEIRDILKARA